MSAITTLSEQQQALIPIAACTASGNITGLNAALRAGLDAGLTISAIKEVLVQLYAYAGFPRSLNGLGELMKVVGERKAQGIQDQAGTESEPVASGPELLAIGSANQTKLVGAPVQGPLFEFAPAIDFYLKAHLFGDIFARTNLDWLSRELATVAALATMQGAEAQLQSHLGISMNVGLTQQQLRHAIEILREHVDAAAAARADAALERLLAARQSR